MTGETASISPNLLLLLKMQIIQITLHQAVWLTEVEVSVDLTIQSSINVKEQQINGITMVTM